VKEEKSSVVVAHSGKHKWQVDLIFQNKLYKPAEEFIFLKFTARLFRNWTLHEMLSHCWLRLTASSIW
jgi:hypothetical protein